MDISVEEYTSINPVSIDVDASLEVAQDLMNEHRIRHLLVTENEEVVGIVSQTDLLAHHTSWRPQLKVKRIMNKDVLYAKMNDSISDVAYELSVKKIGSAVVLDHQGSIYGIFTTTDALNALVDLK